MNEDQFKKMDESISRNIKKFQKLEMSGEMLKDFSVRVAQRIRERENAKILAREKMPAFGLQVLVPVFAAFLLFFTVVFQGPLSMMGPIRPFLPATTSEIADEVTTLKAVGAWNDEDDKTIISDESAVEEMA